MKKISSFLILISLFMLAGCDNRKTYADFSDLHLDRKTAFTVAKSEYYIYFYQSNCPACDNVKAKVIAQAKKGKIPLYFINLDDIYVAPAPDKEYSNIGAGKFSELKIYGTPELLLLKDGVVTAQFIGLAINEHL